MEFKDNLKKYLTNEEIDELIKSINTPSISGLLLNEDKMDKATLLKLFPNIIPHPFVPNGFIFKKSEYQLGKSIYHDFGCFYIQEPSAMMVSYLLNPQETDLVFDMCAAPGGKTIGASLLMKNKGLIIANDISLSRASVLIDNIERMGRSNIIVTNTDLTSTNLPLYILENTFDKIILDAPCSGSGMFKNNKEVLKDWSYNKVLKNAIVQKSLLLKGYKMLKPGGTLVYSTCSFSYEEDEEVILDLLSKTNAIMKPIFNHPSFYRNKNLKESIHLFPSLFVGNGHFIALIQKPGKSQQSSFYKRSNDEKLVDNLDLYSFYKFHYFNTINFISNYIDVSFLHVLRVGIPTYEIKKGIITYKHGLCHLIENLNNIILDEEEMKKYIQGLELRKNNVEDGWHIVNFNDLNIGLVKSKNGILKNHYPKNKRRYL